jgi:predicted lipoprotein with Yx(FWY)xxD motif
MRIKTLLTALLAVAAATLFAALVPLASGATSKHENASKSVVISTRSVPGLGTILVDSKGRTLYMFVPDKQSKVTCFHSCATVWPPVFLPAGGKAVAGGSAHQSLLGSDKDADGGRVVTYNHWPLYGYLGDTKPGTVYGQATNQSGGLWYVLSASGQVIKHKPSKTTTTTTTTTTSTTTTGANTTTTSTTTTPSNSQCVDADNDGDQSGGGPDDADGCI